MAKWIGMIMIIIIFLAPIIIVSIVGRKTLPLHVGIKVIIYSYAITAFIVTWIYVATCLLSAK